MYQGYARPFRLYEPILLILKTADTRIEDVCEAVWRQLLREQPTRGYDAMKDAIMRDRLGDLIRHYYPSEAAPLGEFSYRLDEATADDQISSFLSSTRSRRQCGRALRMGGSLLPCWMLESD